MEEGLHVGEAAEIVNIERAQNEYFALLRVIFDISFEACALRHCCMEDGRHWPSRHPS